MAAATLIAAGISNLGCSPDDGINYIENCLGQDKQEFMVYIS